MTYANRNDEDRYNDETDAEREMSRARYFQRPIVQPDLPATVDSDAAFGPEGEF